MLKKIQQASYGKRKLMIIGLIAAMVVVIIIIRFASAEDNWICQDGKWIKHGHPSIPKPTEACPKGII
jgi:hypothetical protein